ncbi:MAG: M23 family metallopeptidase [Ignavibacteriae bacterium]|nr:M23 family metallopeptidase [Ignavibacteriota bacterium]
MSRTKYRFNTRTLSYEKIELGWKQKISRSLTFLASSAIIGLFFYLLATNFIDSPKEKLLKRENSQLKSQYELLDKRMEQVASVLEDIQRRDDEIYRVIFEAEPIAKEIREAGFGGVNRYKKLEGYKNSDLIIESAKKIDKLSKQLYIQSKSYDDVFNMAKSKEKMIASIPAIQPIPNKNLKRMASGYGMRMHPIHKIWKQHTGMDFSANGEKEIYATGDGVIVSVIKERRGYGNHVIIDHGYGYQTLYGHMQKFNVKKKKKRYYYGRIF